MTGATMTLSARAIFMGLFVAFVSLSPARTIAQVNPSPCSSTAQCPDGFSCQVGAFGLKFCLFAPGVPDEVPAALMASADFPAPGEGVQEEPELVSLAKEDPAALKC